LEILEAAGFSSDRPIYLNGQAISPKSFLAAMAKQNAQNLSPTNGRDFEILRVKASGVSKGKCLEKILDCEMSGNGKISAGTLGVGVPAAIAALMMIEGKTLISSGAATPEEALNPISVIKELERLQTFNFVETVTKPI
jgi:saccharopine dehydrogenase-like NADP-dependent oxidoreductase